MVASIIEIIDRVNAIVFSEENIKRMIDEWRTGCRLRILPAGAIKL